VQLKSTISLDLKMVSAKIGSLNSSEAKLKKDQIVDPLYYTVY
jgi:hypothetical protein